MVDTFNIPPLVAWRTCYFGSPFGFVWGEHPWTVECVMYGKVFSIVEKAENSLQNAEAFASSLGVRSIRYANRVLEKLLGLLTVGEKALWRFL